MSPRLRLYLCRAWLKRCAGAAAARQTQVTKRFNRGLTITTSATRRSVISLNDSPLRAVMEAATDLQPNLDKAIAEALKGLQHPKRTWAFALRSAAYDQKQIFRRWGSFDRFA
jgi:hypothetical protein